MCTGSMSSVISVMVYHHNIMAVVAGNVITDEMVSTDDTLLSN